MRGFGGSGFRGRMLYRYGAGKGGSSVWGGIALADREGHRLRMRHRECNDNGGRARLGRRSMCRCQVVMG